MRYSFTLFAAMASLAGAWASNVLELTPDTFDSIIGQGTPALIEFYATWCGHCKNLAPTYEEVADAYSHVKDKVIIAKVDADGVGKSLGQRYGVSGFPTLKWFDGTGAEPEKYEGGRDLDAFVNFITEKTGVKSNIKPPPPPAFKVLDVHTFDEVALNKENDVIVTFTAPWCGHCKRLKPTYEDVAKDFANEPNCIVANIDGDAATNRPLALKYEVSSFPTIMFFPKGDAEPIHYEGERSEQAFVDFLNEKCGTQRAVGGGLSKLAGRLPELDELASQFYLATGTARSTIFKKANDLAASIGPAAKHYVRVMEKVVNGSEEYLEKESKRLASILKKRTLSAIKLDELQIKANILNAFSKVEEVVEEAAEEVEIKRATAEL